MTSREKDVTPCPQCASMLGRVSRLIIDIAALGCSLLATVTPVAAQQLSQLCSSPYFVQQAFPLNSTAETSWAICWQAQRRYGLYITAAYFRKSPDSPWLSVLGDTRVAEIYVPYHSDSLRYYDIAEHSFPLLSLGVQDCSAAQGGERLVVPGLGPVVCKEVKDRGLAWKDDTRLRRGSELLLWGAIDAENYNYIIEWTFRDDGVVTGRVGSTGMNLPSRPFEAHSHAVTWRIDMDLNGASANSVHLGEHIASRSGPTSTDLASIIAVESSIGWDPEKFSALHIHDKSLLNKHKHRTAYHFVPVRYGNLRTPERFTVGDLWVTCQNESEMSPKDLPSYITPAEPTVDADIIVWYTSSIHHLVRDEDGEELGPRLFSGVTHLMWTGFMLKPHNLFDRSPLFP